MTNTKKMTYSLALSAVLNGEPITNEVRERLEALKASVEKKNSSSAKTMTATQKANASMKEEILAYMTADADRMFTVTELMKEVHVLADLTNQKVTALVRQLKDEGKVERIEDKRKTYFRVIPN